jgi:hypothetical protein
VFLVWARLLRPTIAITTRNNFGIAEHAAAVKDGIPAAWSGVPYTLNSSIIGGREALMGRGAAAAGEPGLMDARDGSRRALALLVEVKV